MKFAFADDAVFLIEKDELVTNREGMKACECVVRISEKAALIEAKSSSPSPNSEERYQAFFDDIREKFITSLNMFCQMRKGEYGEDALNRLPAGLRSYPIDSENYAIYLIIHGNEDYWMPGLQITLQETLRDVIDQWNISDTNVKALNQEMAQTLHLIVDFVPLNERKAIEAASPDSEERRRLARGYFER